MSTRAVQLLGPRFRRLWAASVVSGVGDGMLFSAVPLLAVRYTQYPLTVALTVMAERLPYFALALPAGVLVDRRDPRRLMIQMDIFRGVVVGALAIALLSSRGSLGVLVVAVLLLASGSTVFTAAAQTVLPAVVGAGALGRANTRLNLAETVSVLTIGPAAGALLFSAAAALPFTADAVSFVLSAVLLAGIAGSYRGSRSLEDTSVPAPLPGRVGAEIREGLGWLVRSPPMRSLALVLSGLSGMQAAVVGTQVLYATRTLHLPAAGYGLLLAVSAAGSLLAGLLPIPETWYTPRLLAVGIVIASIGCLVMATAPGGIVAAGGLLIVNFGVSLGRITMLTIGQRLTPPPLLGRVLGAVRTMSGAGILLGTLLGGYLAQRFGLRAPFTVTAVTYLGIVVVYLASNRARSRRADG
ncbi:MAG: MFS transporter [Actinomycetota bacterium]|nr:MFS transporter [Actinomycetota bacterium]